MKEGWLRFWHTFDRPFPVVIGFAVANSLSMIAAKILINIAIWILEWLVKGAPS